MSDQKIVALVLAGGKSSRMGEDKALLHFAGKHLLTRVCEVAETVKLPVYILTSWPEKYQEILPESYQFLLEENHGNGPLVALAEGLQMISADWVLLLGCDLPLLDSEIIHHWMMQLREIPDHFLAMVPYYQSSWEPLCGFYRTQALISLQGFIGQGARSFQLWLSQIDVIKLSLGEEEAAMLFNCNTPEDFEKVKEKH
jgi:molybdopterin-guanine dinucleotide biosynthesis protein A